MQTLLDSLLGAVADGRLNLTESQGKNLNELVDVWAGSAWSEDEFNSADSFLGTTIPLPDQVWDSARESLWSSIEEWLRSELSELANVYPSEETPVEDIRRELEKLIDIRNRYLSQLEFADRINAIDRELRSYEEYEPDEDYLDYLARSAEAEGEESYPPIPRNLGRVDNFGFTGPAPRDEVSGMFDELS
jgi:hypothetical protein